MKKVTLMTLLPASIGLLAAPAAVMGAERLNDLQLARMYGGAGNGNGNGNLGSGNGNFNSGNNNGNGNAGSNSGNGNASDNNGNFDGSNRGNSGGASSVNVQATVQTTAVVPGGVPVVTLVTPPAVPGAATLPPVTLNGVLLPAVALPGAVVSGAAVSGVLMPAGPPVAVGVAVPR